MPGFKGLGGFISEVFGVWGFRMQGERRVAECLGVRGRRVQGVYFEGLGDTIFAGRRTTPEVVCGLSG